MFDNNNLFPGIDISDLAQDELSEKNVVEIELDENSKTEDPKNSNNKITIEDPVGPTIDLSTLSEFDSKSNINVEDVEKEKTKEEQKIEQQDNSQTINKLAKILLDEGVLSDLEDEQLSNVKSGKDLLELIKKEAKKHELSDLTEEQRNYLEASRLGVPTDEYSKIQSAVNEYNNINEDHLKNKNVSFELVRRDFIVRGFNNEDAERYAKLAINSDSYAESGKRALDNLKEYTGNQLKLEIEKRTNLLNERTKKAESQLNEIKDFLKKEDLLPNVKVNSTTKEKIISSITKVVKEDNGNKVNEVMDLYTNDPKYKLLVHAMHVLTKGFTDFTKLTSSSKSKVVNEIDKLATSTDIIDTFLDNKNDNPSSINTSLMEALRDLKL